MIRPGSRKVCEALAVLACTGAMAGCGGSGTSASGGGTAPASTGTSVGIGDEAPHGGPALVQSCKVVAEGLGNLSSSVRAQLISLCNGEGSSNPAIVKATKITVCKTIVRATTPAASQPVALAACAAMQ